MEEKIISVRFLDIIDLWPRNILILLFLFSFRQILGIKNDEINVDDPCSDEFYEYFRSTARKNALIYEEVFNTLPTSTVRKFVDVEDYTDRPKLQRTDPFRVCSIQQDRFIYVLLRFDLF